MKKIFTLVALAVCAMTASAQTYADEPLTATWSMADGEASVAVVAPEEAVVSSNWDMGPNIAIDATPTGVYFEKTFTRFTCKTKKDNKRSAVGENWIDFTINVKDGLTFTADKVSFDITKIGTGDPKIYVDFIAGDKTTVLGDDVEIRKNREETPSESQSFDLTDKNITTTTSATLRIYIGKLTAGTKQVGIANVVVSGTVSGTATNKATYTVAVQANPAEGGKVQASADIVTEGNEVTLTATPNRGYSFVNWTDAAGAEVSKEAVYTFVPEGNIDYTANFSLADARTIAIASSDETAGKVETVVLSDGAVVSDGIVLDGDNLIVKALNNKGYLFKEWSDGNTEAVRSIVVDGDLALNAIFEELPAKQTIVYLPLTANTNITVRENCSPEFIYADLDTENGFTLNGEASFLGENMQQFLYPQYDAADLSTKKDSTFYININPNIGEGEVFVLRSIEFNAVRNGTDAGDWRVSVVRDGDEENAEVVAEDFKVERNTVKYLPHYYFNVTTDRVAEQSAEVRITICAAGNNKSYNLGKLRIQGYVCDKTAVGISEVKTVSTDAAGIYNLAGQRVSAPQKGLYIRDGKKYVK